MSGETEIAVSQPPDEGFVVVKLTGRCCAATCPSLQRYVEQLAPPSVTDVYFDLSGADSIDSTFTGLLVSRVRKSPEKPRPRAHLVSPSPRICQALELMHVLQLFDVVDSPPQRTTQWRELHRISAGPEDMADLVIRMHESLIAADRRNKPVFGPVVDTFRAEREGRRNKTE